MNRRVVIYGSDSGLRVWGAALESIPGARVVTIRHPDAAGRLPRLSIRTLLAARKAAAEADVVIALSTLLGAAIAIATHTPVIVVDVGAARHAAVHGRIAGWLVSMLLRSPDRIVALTDAHSIALDRLTASGRVRTIPQPVSTTDLEWHPDRLAPYVLSAGASGRDLLTLCDAAAGLPLDVRVIEGGGRELVPAPGTRIGAEFPPNLIRYGRVGRPTYEGLLVGASAVVLPLPRSEYPVGVTVMLDAMAAGVPVVATAVPSVTYYQGEDTAELVEPADPGALRAALERVALDPDRAAVLSRNAREHVRSVVSTEQIAQTIAGLIDEVATCAS